MVCTLILRYFEPWLDIFQISPPIEYLFSMKDHVKNSTVHLFAISFKSVRVVLP